MTKQVRQAITPTHVLGSTGTAEACSLGHRTIDNFKGDLGLGTSLTVTANNGAGTAAAPAFTFVGDPNTGVFNSAADAVAIATNGVARVTVSTTALTSTLGASIEGLTVGRGPGALASNTALGSEALSANTTGNDNTATGRASLVNNTSGCANNAYGRNALQCNSTGSNNIGIGTNAGRTGCSPLAITTASNQVIIGNNDHNCFVAGCAWATSSDCRDKTDVGPVAYGLDFVLALEPVEYKWDKRSRYGWDEEKQAYVAGDGTKKDTHCLIGFLAQQVLAVEKQIAPHRNSIIVSDDDPLNLNLGETHIIPALVKAIQELAGRVEALEGA